MNKLSVTEYAKNRKISRQAVLKRLKLKKELVGVLRYEKVGNVWILYK